MNLTDCLKGRRSEVCYKNSEATDITVTAANIVYGVEHDAAGNVRSTTKDAKKHQRAVWTRNAAYRALLNGLALNISTAILNYLIDGYSNVQEAKYIDMAKDNADETNSSDQDNETTNDSFMGIVANAT